MTEVRLLDTEDVAALRHAWIDELMTVDLTPDLAARVVLTLEALLAERDAWHDKYLTLMGLEA